MAIPTPDYSCWVDGVYYGYLGDSLRFSEHATFTGKSLKDVLEQLFAHPVSDQLSGDHVQLTLAVVGYRPMTAEDLAERERLGEAEKQITVERPERQRSPLAISLERLGIEVPTSLL
ncbi:MAG TPA: hypothetical protein VLE72_03680 [Candidatus Saccharimonadales bacterium]|nr:hypothetical protein [Candidatus Saccharimonadales bacterium]